MVQGGLKGSPVGNAFFRFQAQIFISWCEEVKVSTWMSAPGHLSPMHKISYCPFSQESGVWNYATHVMRKPPSRKRKVGPGWWCPLVAAKSKYKSSLEERWSSIWFIKKKLQKSHSKQWVTMSKSQQRQQGTDFSQGFSTSKLLKFWTR